MKQHEVVGGVYEIDFDTSDVDTLLDAFTKSISMPSLQEFLADDVSRYFEADIASRFESEGDAKSGAWAPLKDATIAIREALGFGPDPINVRTGKLKEFVTHSRQHFSGDGWAEMELPGPASDPMLQQKLTHAQRGAQTNPKAGFGPTPPRPVLAVDAADLEKVMALLALHIEGYMASGGLIGEIVPGAVAAA